MSRGEAEHLFAFAGIDRVDRHRHDSATPRRPAASCGRAHPAAAVARRRVIGLHRCNQVLARAIVDLDRALEVTLSDAGHAHAHAAHVATYPRFAALTQTFDHGRSLLFLAGHSLLHTHL